jgi:hypothetical protein
MRLTKAALAASTPNSAALRLLKVEAGINGLLPTWWVPSIYSVSLLIRLRYALEEVTDFCVRPLGARSSRPAAKRKMKACDFCSLVAKTQRHEGYEIFRASSAVGGTLESPRSQHGCDGQRFSILP